MELGTKIQMDNGFLGIQQGVIGKKTILEEETLVIIWDVDHTDIEEFDHNSFEQFDGKVLSDNWKFKYIDNEGNLLNN